MTAMIPQVNERTLVELVRPKEPETEIRTTGVVVRTEASRAAEEMQEEMTGVAPMMFL